MSLGTLDTPAVELDQSAIAGRERDVVIVVDRPRRLERLLREPREELVVAATRCEVARHDECERDAVVVLDGAEERERLREERLSPVPLAELARDRSLIHERERAPLRLARAEALGIALLEVAPSFVELPREQQE